MVGISTAVFSFEGIGLVRVTPYANFVDVNHIQRQVIPITDAMREPHKFPAVLTGVMAFLTGMAYHLPCPDLLSINKPSPWL
jgi:hypothetical protein